MTACDTPGGISEGDATTGYIATAGMCIYNFPFTQEITHASLPDGFIPDRRASYSEFLVGSETAAVVKGTRRNPNPL
jgi:hypothetical protein